MTVSYIFTLCLASMMDLRTTENAHGGIAASHLEIM